MGIQSDACIKQFDTEYTTEARRDIIERMRTPVRHISYGIRHTALSRTYAIVAYVRHNNNAGSPVIDIPRLPH